MLEYQINAWKNVNIVGKTSASADKMNLLPRYFKSY